MAVEARRMERIVCPVCGRRISAYVPARGDGTGLRLMPHRIVNARRGDPCYAGGRIVVRTTARRSSDKAWVLE